MIKYYINVIDGKGHTLFLHSSNYYGKLIKMYLKERDRLHTGKIDTNIPDYLWNRYVITKQEDYCNDNQTASR